MQSFHQHEDASLAQRALLFECIQGDLHVNVFHGYIFFPLQNYENRNKNRNENENENEKRNKNKKIFFGVISIVLLVWQNLQSLRISKNDRKRLWLLCFMIQLTYTYTYSYTWHLNFFLWEPVWLRRCAWYLYQKKKIKTPPQPERLSPLALFFSRNQHLCPLFLFPPFLPLQLHSVPALGLS